MNIKNLIAQNNIKLTTARVKILEILQEATKPISYEDIKIDLPMDKATFYRNILKFENEGILNSFEANDRKRYFELKQKPHAHFVCIKCNAVECIEKIDLNLKNYQISNIIINGTCPNCQ
ncbi:MAG: transcriptional repressor [Arcobacteraceae bacterium]|jgi:Fur family ferric uptake transcriptional regulator|nr:transcriptional repressor [Arcobacteraceae bacterium]